MSGRNSTVPFESQQEQRRSERAIPFISDEETILIALDPCRALISKMLDLSEGGTLVYLVEGPEAGLGENAVCRLMLYHQGEVFAVDSKVARRSGKLIGFEFINPPLSVVNRIQAKLIQMEVAWMRVQRQNRVYVQTDDQDTGTSKQTLFEPYQGRDATSVFSVIRLEHSGQVAASDMMYSVTVGSEPVI